MEPGILLVVLIILGIPIALAIWLIVRAVSAQSRIEELSDRLIALESEMIRLKREKEPPQPVEPAPAPAPQPKIITPPPVAAPPQIVTPQPVISSERPSVATPLPVSAPPMPVPVPPRPTTPAFNWEQFLGVKGFAWIGGFALFLGVVFAIQYAFAHHLISPELQAALGFITGLGLLVGGVVMSRENFPALSQTLCATGVVILYAVTFACREIYHFLTWADMWWDALPAFAMMVLVTATGFFLAVRLNALVVAILGMLGGFLTPVLIHTNHDNPLGLFGYIAILDAGLIFVALNKRWHFLTAFAALGTAIMQIAWAGEFFTREKYFEGDKILIALAVLLGFDALWLAANWLAKRRARLCENWRTIVE